MNTPAFLRALWLSGRLIVFALWDRTQRRVVDTFRAKRRLGPSAERLTVFRRGRPEILQPIDRNGELIRSKYDSRYVYRIHRLRPEEASRYADSGLLDLSVGQARSAGLAAPRFTWTTDDPLRIQVLVEGGETRLDELNEVDRAEDVDLVLSSTAKAVNFLADLGGTASIDDADIVKTRDGRWLLSEVQPSIAPTLQTLRAERNVQTLLQRWCDAYCDSSIDAVPVLQPGIRAWLGFGRATIYETFFGWCFFRLRNQQSSMTPNEILGRLGSFFDRMSGSSIGPASNTFSVHRERVPFGIPDEWFSYVDKFEWRRDNGGCMEGDPPLFTERDTIEDRIALGVDSYWIAFIESAMRKRADVVQDARGLLETYQIEDVKTDPDLLEMEERRALAYVMARELIREESLVGEHSIVGTMTSLLTIAEEERSRILAGGYLHRDECCQRLSIENDEDLYILMRSGLLMAVIDHNDLLFPRFQFASERGMSMVSTIGRVQGSVFPSWRWTSRWFVPLETAFGANAASLVESGKFDMLRSLVGWVDVSDSSEGPD